MLRMVARVLIFIFSLFLFVLGISEMIYFFAQYMQELDPLNMTLSIVQFVFCILGGIGGLICITRGKRTELLFISNIVLLGLGIYYFVVFNGHAHESYFLALAILNTFISLTLLVSLFWNRKRI